MSAPTISTNAVTIRTTSLPIGYRIACAQVRGKVLSTLAYPIVLAIVAAFVVFALMIFVVPKVVEQFEGVGQQLPLLTRIVIAVSDFLAGYWWLLLGGFAL